MSAVRVWAELEKSPKFHGAQKVHDFGEFFHPMAYVATVYWKSKRNL